MVFLSEYYYKYVFFKSKNQQKPMPSTDQQKLVVEAGDLAITRSALAAGSAFRRGHPPVDGGGL